MTYFSFIQRHINFVSSHESNVLAGKGEERNCYGEVIGNLQNKPRTEALDNLDTIQGLPDNDNLD
jgi:hypothetical protein